MGSRVPEYDLPRHPNSKGVPAYPIGTTHDEALRAYYTERLFRTPVPKEKESR